MRATMLALGRQMIEVQSGDKVSDEEWEEMLRSPSFQEKSEFIDFAANVSGMAIALDEWQADIEKRLAEVRHDAGFDRPPPGPPKEPG